MPTLPLEAIPSHVLAIDIGGTKLAAGIVDAAGTLLDVARTPTHVEEGPDRVLGRILGLSRTLLGRSPVPVQSVGVGCGGPLDTERGLVQNPPNLPGWIDYPLAGRLREALGLPVALDNDANAAALAEFHFGAGRGTRHMVYLTVSTGIGSGLILNGELYRGKRGNAGELGHLQVRYDGDPCNCGGRGCLEAYASGTGIARRARERAARHPESLLARLAPDPRDLTAETVLTALRAGDPVARELWDETLDILAAGVASIVNAFDPERVVIGGGITNFGEFLFPPLRERVEGRAMPALVSGVDICPAELAEHVGVLGAAAVALRERQEVLV
ncbi:transcriptional regulator/sugar kinase [Deinococcus aerius]|uniref:Transcriptional regulator/sugar kinase n=1 Tax=Deinococcus aerius TaxID=200253 RepID=A0A2I9D631_9DEIO|nr:ROK family protein [Deinococcus aerius]GBF06146.1 transcriptional regulator/sugar kinase [Deinococcus aerius]